MLEGLLDKLSLKKDAEVEKYTYILRYQGQVISFSDDIYDTLVKLIEKMDNTSSVSVDFRPELKGLCSWEFKKNHDKYYSILTFNKRNKKVKYFVEPQSLDELLTVFKKSYFDKEAVSSKILNDMKSLEKAIGCNTLAFV
ncbi:hypothetical protein [Butyrivibrio sp. NC3005]|uniref:hypothetical protein n=1 Tax=Butyrivibrio sp. NC3005 TaxID=1280685 RepID=UPI000401C59C|nr:hypothetical protein [Butyrivibrio sp. NC3005]